MNHEYVGYMAAILTSAAFFVQALKSFRTRDLSGISLGMYTMFTVGVACWLAYGLLIEKWPLIVTNVFTLTFATSVLLLKIRQVYQTRVSMRFVEPVASQHEHEK